MRTPRTTIPTHEELLESVLDQPLNEEDALLWMTLFHTHQIHLCAPNAADGKKPFILFPQTQRGAAEIIAALWPDRDGERSKYAYWYGQYNRRTPYEVLSQVPAPRLTRLLELRERLAREPRVRQVIEDP